MTEQPTTFAEWVILEVMGHRRLAGYLTETQIAGAGFLRLDVPADPPATQYYRPDSVYAITPTTEEIARTVAKRNRPAPVQRWELEPVKELSVQGDDRDRNSWGEGPF